MQVAYDAVDFTGRLFLPSHIVNESACIEVSLVIAYIIVHRTLACRLVSMEIAFNEESGNTMLQYSEIAEITVAVVCGIAAVAFSVEINVAAHVHVRVRVI